MPNKNVGAMHVSRGARKSQENDSSKYNDVCCACSVLSPAGVSCGILYAVSTIISLLFFSKTTNPHHRPYLSSIWRYIRLTRGQLIPITLPPGFVYFVIGAIDEKGTKLQYLLSFD